MRTFGLIGYPLGHSFSATYWNNRFKAEGLTDHQYQNFPLESIEAFPILLRNRPDIVGLNVTVPHKTAVIPYLDELDATAKAVDAVNTIAVCEGRLIGYNTDTIGFRKSVRPFLDHRHERALILGTGGSAKAVAHALGQLGVTCFFASRSHTNDRTFSYDQLQAAHYQNCKLIVNCTPVGMAPDTSDLPPIDTTQLTSDHFVVDLIYNPEKTALLTAAEAQGAMILNGADMLRFQAEAAWELLIAD
jgi:shikimate dehydrogenase